MIPRVTIDKARALSPQEDGLLGSRFLHPNWNAAPGPFQHRQPGDVCGGIVFTAMHSDSYIVGNFPKLPALGPFPSAM